MVIGSHNSMTYLKPRHWYGWLMIPFARCQNKTLAEQYKAGARCFDLRIRPDMKHSFSFAHGFMEMSDGLAIGIDPLYSMAVRDNEKVYIRIILEDVGMNYPAEAASEWFVNICESFARYYPMFTFFEGRRKSDWKLLYDFPFKPKVQQFVSSMADDARWYERIFPRLYARRTNGTHIPDEDCDIALYDFI